MSRFSRLRNSLTKTGRAINKLTKTIATNQKDIRKYESTRKEIASKLKIIDRDSVNLQSGNIELDVNQTLKKLKSKGTSKKEAVKQLQSIVKKSVKSAREARKLSGDDIRKNIAVKELVELRLSEKYKAMVNSATKKSFVKNEADFWYRTVRIATKNLGIEPKSLLGSLNTSLKKEGLETMSGTNIAMLLSEV